MVQFPQQSGPAQIQQTIVQSPRGATACDQACFSGEKDRLHDRRLASQLTRNLFNPANFTSFGMEILVCSPDRSE